MDDQPQGRAGNLKALAEAKFGALSEAERLLLEKAPTADPAYCGPSHEDRDNDPKDADHWGSTRKIRSQLLAWLCTDEQVRKRVHRLGIQVYGANVTGSLNLMFANIPFPIALQHCRLTDGIDLSKAGISQLDLAGSLVGGLSADGVIVKNDVIFGDDFVALGEVSLLGAQIGGDLTCSDGAFNNPLQEHLSGSGKALSADGINVKGGVFLDGRFSANGEVRFLGSQIGGSFACVGGTFTNPAQAAVAGSGKALSADGINVKGHVLLRKSTASGEVRFNSAQVDANLECDGGTFANPPQLGVPGSGMALNAERIIVKGSIFLRQGFAASGEVRLLRAQIGSDLECAGGTFTNPPLKDGSSSGIALNADGIEVKGDVFLGEPFAANGAVSVSGAQIGGDLDCVAGSFINTPQKDIEKSGTALNAERIIVTGAVFLRVLLADGGVDLRGAQIGGVDCTKGNFQKAILDLTDTSAVVLYDSGLNETRPNAGESPTVWPQSGRLFLDGFVYGRISSKGRINVDRRIEWLRLQPKTPFPSRSYLQLAKVLRESGDSDGALRVLEKMEELRRSDEEHGPIGHVESLVLKGSIGYGYYPARAIWEIVGLSALGWIIYRRSYLAGTMAPTDKDAYTKFQAESQVPPHYPTFSPLVYSVENSLPLVKLGQADKWQPDPEVPPPQNRPTPKLGHGAAWLPSKFQSAWREPLRGLTAMWDRMPKWLRGGWQWVSTKTTAPKFVLWFLWLQILLGWLLATLFVAGVSGIVHKQ